MTGNERNTPKPIPYRYFNNSPKELLSNEKAFERMLEGIMEQRIFDSHVVEALLTIAQATKVHKPKVSQTALVTFAGLLKDNIEKSLIRQVIDLVFSGRYMSITESFKEVVVEAVLELPPENETRIYLDKKLVVHKPKEYPRPEQVQDVSEALYCAGQLSPKDGKRYLDRYVTLGGDINDPTYVKVRIMNIRGLYRIYAKECQEKGTDVLTLLHTLVRARFIHEKAHRLTNRARKFATSDSLPLAKGLIQVPHEYARTVLHCYLDVFKNELNLADISFISRSAFALHDEAVKKFLAQSLEMLKLIERDEEQQRIFDFLLTIFPQDISGLEPRSNIGSSSARLHPDMKGVKYAENGMTGRRKNEDSE